MAAKHVVQCRICKEKFDTNEEEYVLEGQKAYYHKSCYTKWKNNKDSLTKVSDENDYKEGVINYLYCDVKMTIDFAKFESQWKNFTKPGKDMTPKGIYFAVRYFFEIQKGSPEKAAGGIGIVPYVYNKSYEYWSQLEKKQRGTLDAIIKQMSERNARRVQFVVPKKKQENKAKWDLNQV